MSNRSPPLRIRPLQEKDLLEADRIFRVAFGTFLGLPRPEEFAGDTDFIGTRFRTDREAAFAAEEDGRLVGTNFVTTWGSVGFFGPLTVTPDRWGHGVAKRLLEPTIDLFERRGTSHRGLFTFAQSPKHVGLYQRFGFWPRFLTAVMSKQVEARPETVSTFSALAAGDRPAALEACRSLADSLVEGFDPRREIESVREQQLGDTVLVRDGARLAAFGICHCGPRTEAGSDTCYVKLGAARPGASAAKDFERLLDAAESLAASRGLAKLVAGANAGRPEAWAAIVARGFRPEMQGVAMQHRNEPGYNRPGVYVVDDWR